MSQIIHVEDARITSGADDVEQSRSGSISFGSGDIELVDDTPKKPGQTIGLRFNELNIPQGAVIVSASIQFQVDAIDVGVASLDIRGADSDNAAAFTKARFDVSSRQLTDATVHWNPAGWTAKGAAGPDQRTADVSSIVQEIVDREGWTPDNSMAFVITGSGERTAESYEGSRTGAPLLHVEWALPETEPDLVPPTVTMSGPEEGAIVSGTISLSAFAFDNVAVQDVQFRLDSENIGASDTTDPYGYELDTTLFDDGTVALSAVATDSSGNQTASGPLTITIDNGSIGPPPPPPPTSGTIRVPEDYATIQEAVDAAGDGDTVLVAPGTYAGGIVISGKSITLASEYHTTRDASLIDATIISGGSPAVYVGASAPNATIEGFHFVGGSKSIQFFAENGSALDNFFDDTGGDAISFEDTGGVARGNRIYSPGDDGIDVDHARGDLLIENNVIEFARDDGIEIRNGSYKGPLVNITIKGNSIQGSGEDGIQIIDYAAESDRQFLIERNLIRTSADAGLGLMDNGETIEDLRAASMQERIHVFNNTFDGNSHGISGGDELFALNNIISNSSVLGIKNVDAMSMIANTLFFNNGQDYIGSNVDESTTFRGDPLYTSTFGLESGSPAIDAGTSSFVHGVETILDIPPSGYSGAGPDLGWLEF